MINGTTRLIKFVSTKLRNSLKFPLFDLSLKITLLDKKYEIITPIEKEPMLVR